MTNSIAKNSLIFIIGAFATKAFRIIILPIYIYFLSQNDVGKLGLIEAIIAFTTLLSGLGLPAAIQRVYVDIPKKERNSFFAEILTYKYGFSLILLIIVLILSNNLNYSLTYIELFLAFLIGILFSNITILENKYIIEEHALKYRIFTILVHSINFLFIVIVLFLSNSIVYILVAQVVNLICWNLYVAIKVGFEFTLTSRLIQVMKIGLGGMLYAISLWGLALSDRLILERLTSMKDISIYSVGYQVAIIISIIAFGIRDSWRPRFYKMLKQESNPEKFISIQMVYIGALACLVLILQLICLFTKVYFPLGQYQGVETICAVVSVGMLFYALSISYLNVLFYFKKMMEVSVMSLISLGINVVLNFMLIPKYGMIAAAIVTVITYAIQLIFFLVYSKSLFPLNYKKKTVMFLSFGIIICLIIPTYLTYFFEN
ncbi:MAG: oligosaccharide flippase family protein [Cyclobacteriaceae bacterium]